MKSLLILGLVVAGAFALPPQQQPIVVPRGLVASIINSTIENTVRPAIPEPILIDELEITLPENVLINGNLAVASLELSGIKGFQLKKLAVDLGSFKVDFVLDVPNLVLNTKYTGDLTLGDDEGTEIIGDGVLSLSANGVEIVASGRADFSSGIQVSGVAAQLTLEAATLKIEDTVDPGLGEEISAFLNDNAVTFIDDNAVEIGLVASPIVEQVLNEILAVLFPPEAKIQFE